jgi:predicted ATP-dependent serine protease
LLDKTKLNDAALELQKAFNTGSQEAVDKAIRLLQALRPSAGVPLQAIRADQLKLPESDKLFLPTELKWLDAILGGGLRRQELMLIGGCPHQGKTHLSIFVAGCYLRQGATVMHFNGEDLLSDIRDTYRLVIENDEQLQDLYYVDVTDSLFDPMSISRVLADTPADIVVVDYLDIMTLGGEQKGVSDWLAVSELTRQLRLGVSKKHDCVVITGTQLNFGDGPGTKRLFRSKVGKAAHCDVMLNMGETHGEQIEMRLDKARGRKVRSKDSIWTCDFSTMDIHGEALE